jgi:hypothetical protein
MGSAYGGSAAARSLEAAIVVLDSPIGFIILPFLVCNSILRLLLLLFLVA